MSEKIIHTKIPEIWLDTLNEEVKPLLKRTEFFVEMNSPVDPWKWAGMRYISVRLYIDESDDKQDFLFRLAGRDLESTYETALKRYVADKLGHII